MAQSIISGVGCIALRELINGAGVFGGGATYANVNLAGNPTTVKGSGRGCVDGILTAVDEKISVEEYTLTITGELFDRRQLELLFQEESANSTNLTSFATLEGQIQAATSTLIAGKVTTALGNANTVDVSILGRTGLPLSGSQKLTRVAVAPGDGEFRVNTTSVGAEVLQFNVLQEGGAIVIGYNRTYAGSRSTIGVEASALKITELEFTADLKSDAFPYGQRLIIPRAKAISLPTFDSSAAPISYSLVLRPVLKAGKKKVFELIELTAADVT